MAQIDINLSANLITQLNASNASGSTLGEDISSYFLADYAFAQSHQEYSSTTNLGASFRYNFADGAYVALNGNVAAGGNAVTAAQLQAYMPNYFSATAGGQIHYSLDYSSGTPAVSDLSATFTALSLQTLLPTTSADYDPALGNVTLTVGGAINFDGDSNISGTVTSVRMSADKLLRSSELQGNFVISGNEFSLAEQGTPLALSGTATSYNERYTDGSSVSLSNIAVAVNSGTVINQSLLSDPNNLGGDDVINITLGTKPVDLWLIASGAGNDRVTINGGGSGVRVDAGSGNDIVKLGDSNHDVNGGDGIDTVAYSGAKAAYSVSKAGTGYTVTSSAGIDNLSGVERVQFSDSVLALDIDGTGGQAYRLYQAAFNRVPDAAGLGYWIKTMDAGQSLINVANNFMNSKEFTDMYGVNQSNAQFLDSLYHNVLHRAGDQGGFDWWLGHLDKGDVTRAYVLAEFGESAENKAALIGAIGNGFVYTDFTG